MFFDNDTLAKRKYANLRVLPPLPSSLSWTAPKEPPRLENIVAYGVDTETKDPDLKEHGPGWARGPCGHIVGVSLAAQHRDGSIKAWYFPLRHEVCPEQNLPPEYVLPWLKGVLETPNIPKVGCNITYDVGWLQEDNIYVKGYLNDCQFAEALLDEDAKTALDNLAEKYLGKHKVTTFLYEWCQQAYGGSIKDQRANIYKAPPSLVGPYAEADAYLPLQILPLQWKWLEFEDLLRVYDLECRLIPLLVRIRYAGLSVNLELVEQLYEEYKIRIINEYKYLHDITNMQGSVASNKDVAKMLKTVGIECPQTGHGNPSATKEFLSKQTDEVSKLILKIRELEKLRETFLKGSILDSHIDGKVHCTLNQLREDAEGISKGTKTGRLSCTDPNLQTIPTRTNEGKRIREAFIKDKGHTCYAAVDYSQIEYVMLAHFATGPGSDELRKKYNEDPKTDYHRTVQDNIKDLTGIFIERGPLKNINFGLLYGEQEKGLAHKAGFTEEEAAKIFKHYHVGAPYVLPTMKAISDEARTFGYVTTITGRRIRFKLWEAKDWKKRGIPLPYSQALEVYGTEIRLANLYKAVNYKLQGSATGDVIKLSMLACYEQGLFDAVGVPRLQIHDELNFSIDATIPNYEKIFRDIAYTMENAVKLRVPIRCTWKAGQNWSECK